MLYKNVSMPRKLKYSYFILGHLQKNFLGNIGY